MVDDSIESDEAAGADDKKKKETKTVPFTKLFHFSDCDGYLIVIGAIGAIGVGGALPLFALLFGDLINGINNPNVTEAAQEIVRVLRSQLKLAKVKYIFHILVHERQTPLSTMIAACITIRIALPNYTCAVPM